MIGFYVNTMEHNPYDDPSETLRFENRFRDFKRKHVKRLFYWLGYYLLFVLVTIIAIVITKAYNPSVEYNQLITKEGIWITITVSGILSYCLANWDDWDYSHHLINQQIPNAFDRSLTHIGHQLEQANNINLHTSFEMMELVPIQANPSGFHYEIPSLDPHDYNVKNGWIYWNWLWSFKYRMKRWLQRTIDAKYIRMIINCESESEEWNWYKDNENEIEMIGIFFVYRNRLFHLDVRLFDDQYMDGLLVRTFHLEYGDYDSIDILHHRTKYLDALLRLKYDNQLEYFAESDQKGNWEIDINYECMGLSQLTSFLFYLRMANDPNELIQWVG